jgi:hypothetical protein
MTTCVTRVTHVGEGVTMATQQGVLPYLANDNASWRVCVAMHLDPEFAGRAYDELCVPTLRALAPSPGLDLPLIAHNAVWLRDRRVRHAAGLTVAAVAAGLAFVTVLTNAFTGGLTLLVLSLLGGLAWSAWCRLQQAWHAADLVERKAIWDPGPGSLSAEQQARIAAINDSNLCIYSVTCPDPFPGLGKPLTSDVGTPVDVTKPKDRTRPVQTFTAGELHRHLGKKLHGTRQDGLTGRNVAYVSGSWARRFQDIYPGPARIPAVRLPPQRVREIAERHSEGARTYVNAQSILHGGLLVCTLSARFTVQNGVLSWDVSTRLLRPVSLAPLRNYHAPLTPGARTAWEAVRVVTEYPRDLLESPRRLLDHLTERRRIGWLTNPRTPLTKQEEDRLFRDVGATTSLRASAVGTERLDFNQINDIQAGFHHLLYTLSAEIVVFLESRNVSVAQFRRTHNTSVTTILGNIHAHNVAIGPGGTAGNTGTPPTGGPAPGGGPTP